MIELSAFSMLEKSPIDVAAYTTIGESLYVYTCIYR